MCEVMSSAARLETWFFQVNQELGEIGGVFVSKQPSDTDMGAKEPKTDGGGRAQSREQKIMEGSSSVTCFRRSISRTNAVERVLGILTANMHVSTASPPLVNICSCEPQFMCLVSRVYVSVLRWWE